MSIFNKQIHQIQYQDLLQLLQEGAEENIRLEFKRDYPGKHNLLKKISSFANTYGGFLIMGIEEDKRGRARALTGIDPIRRLDQTLVEWCFEEIYPPIVPFVSPPIPHPEKQGKVFYVVYIEESYETPHILNKSRNGLYIRTDEYSQRFMSRLANFDELEYLIEKRKKNEEFRKNLLTRANKRLKTHQEMRFSEHHGTDSLLNLCLLPLFPGSRIFPAHCLIPFAQKSSIPARGTRIPDFSDDHIHSQWESIIAENPGISYYSYFEINIYNMLFYVSDVTREYPIENSLPNPFCHVIPIKVLMAELILFLQFARNFYHLSGFDGILQFLVGMENIRGRSLRFEGQEDNLKIISYLDNEMTKEKKLSVSDLKADEQIALETFKEICFSLGFKNIYSLGENKIQEFYREGLKYLNREDK